METETKEVKEVIFKDEKIDHEIVDWMSFETQEIKDKWDQYEKDNPTPEEQKYSVLDYIGKGKIQSGNTVRFFILHLKEEGFIELLKSPIYVINKDFFSDIQGGRIKPLDCGFVWLTAESQQDIIDCLRDEPQGLTNTKIATITGLSRNTIYRGCRHLIQQGVLKREIDLSYSVIKSDKWYYSICGWIVDKVRARAQ